MIRYALTIFSSAFLLFLVQPILAKQVLPWFGGSAAVWSTCLMFFQFVLLCGYAYADWSVRYLRPRMQVLLHGTLLIISLFSLPIIASSQWKPTGNEDPASLILGLLTATIGLPYFLLSTTGPLLQAWFNRSYPQATNVYRLFALSNGASLIALIAYPFVVEPYTTTEQQSISWSVAYGLFVVLCISSAYLSLGGQGTPLNTKPTSSTPERAPRVGDYLLWMTLAAMGSFMLIAVTNHITHDVASVPFLWIVPLSLYLLSFVLCFEGRSWYKRNVFFLPLAILVPAMAWGLHAHGGVLNIKQAIPLFCAGLMVMCMFFHGELAALKPSPRYLTSFYLMISLGGAVGGLLIGFVAPKLFNTYYEFGLGLILTTLLAAYLPRRRMLPDPLRSNAMWWRKFSRGANPQRIILPSLALIATLVTSYHVYTYVDMLSNETRVMSRNFYGTLRVKDYGSTEPSDGTRRLLHGVIMHGEQFLSPARQREATSYYGHTSGVGRIIRLKTEHAASIRVGVIGLGAGTLAVYGRPQDFYRFYEINPQVVALAQSEFSYLKNSSAHIETVLGDARLSLEREQIASYDIIVIDAFSSDSIPTHLMTQQAMAVYLKNLKPDGVIAFHTTNRFINLPPVIKRIADYFNLSTSLISDSPSEESPLSNTDWVLVTRSQVLLQQSLLSESASEIDKIPHLPIWTDSFNNLFRVLKN